MIEGIAAPNEVLNALVLLSILGIIGIFLVKLYNVLHRGQEFSIQMSTVFLALGIICFLFIEIGLFLSVPLNVKSVMLEFNFYNWFARVFLILIVVFWFVELIFNVVDQVAKVADGPERMSKRRSDRITNIRKY